MAKKMIKIKSMGKYNGHSFGANGAVTLKLKFSYEELTNYYIKLPLLRSENTAAYAKIEDGDILSLGTFMFKNYAMDHDGEGTITFGSLYDHVEAENLNALVADKEKLIKFLFKAEVEDEESEEEEE
jgi:hypothetical protein